MIDNAAWILYRLRSSFVTHPADSVVPTPAQASDAPKPRKARPAPRSLPEQIAEDIGHAIVAGQYRAGERLIETELAAEFGVSRGPIRDGLKLLERRRLVELQPRRGAYVRAVSLDSVADLFNVRLALSTQAARFMAQAPASEPLEALRRRVGELEAMARDEATTAQDFVFVLTRAVHAISRGSGNDLIVELMDDLARHTVWTTIWREPLHARTAAHRQQVAREMAAVLQAIERAEAAAAERTLRAVLEQTRDAALASLADMRRERIDPRRLLPTGDR